MRKPTCILLVRSDGIAVVCSYCPEEKRDKAGTLWAEGRNLQPSHGICAECEAKQFPFMAEFRRAKAEGRAPVYTEANCPDRFILGALTGTGGRTA